MVRAHFGVFERRRSSNDSHVGGNTAATRTNPDKHGMLQGSNTESTRNQHGAHTDDQGPSRTVTAERRTNTAETRAAPDEHGPTRHLHGPSRTHTDSHGQSRQSYGCPRTLHGSYTDHPGCRHLSGSSRANTAVLNFPKLPCWPPGAPRTFPDIPGPTGIAEDYHGGYTVHTPDRAGCNPC